MKTTIIPQIKKIDVIGDSLHLCNFYLSDHINEMLPIAKEIFDINKKGNAQYPINFIKEEMSAESYRISVKKDSINIMATGSKGLMYGLFTLSELGIINDDIINECEISDEPSLQFRGLSDDISRGAIPTTQTFFNIIKRIARYKYNTYMPYIEDVFKFQSIPAWGKYSDSLDKDEWCAIIDFAKRYHVEVRPIINLLGHFDKLTNIKELQHLALRYPDGTMSHEMDPKNPEVREVIQVMLKEIVDCFGEGIIHCGGDEPISLTKIFGADEAATLFNQHYQFVFEELAKLNCKLMMYCDFFAPPWGDYAVDIERVVEIPKGTQFVFWDYAIRDAYPALNGLHNFDLDIYISPGSWTWKRLSCDIKTSFFNVKGLLKADNARSKGMIMSSWADGGDTLLDYAWPGVVIGANFCWSPNSDYTYEEFYALYHKSIFGFEYEQAMLLDSIYHHDRLVNRTHENEFQEEFFKDPANPITYPLRNELYKIQEAMVKAKEEIQTLTPLRNAELFYPLYLTIARVAFLADKLSNLPDHRLTTIEEGLEYIESTKQLANDIKTVK
ncbi:MAG: family 20 glycosylhydrolase, partial [Oscillospiraceae bacterium]